MPYPSASKSRRNCSDRRKPDDFPSPWIVERRIQAERRGIEVVEFDFDERIALGNPKQLNAGMRN